MLVLRFSGAAHGSDEDKGAQEKVLRANRMKVETREVSDLVCVRVFSLSSAPLC